MITAGKYLINKSPDGAYSVRVILEEAAPGDTVSVAK